MGILKHLVLPVFCLYHLGTIGIALTQGKKGLAVVAGFFESDDPDLTRLEVHFLGAYVGISLGLLFNSLGAILVENSHYRGMATGLELIVAATDAIDGLYFSGPGFEDGAYFLVGLSVLATFGLIVHAMEPGIFTKDKKEKSS